MTDALRPGGLGDDPAVQRLIPIVRVRGSHREVGRQIGEATADVVRRAVDFGPDQLPEGRAMSEQLALADEYRQITAATLPWLVDELAGVAEAAHVDPLALFAASIEEIWTHRPSQAGTPATRETTSPARGGGDPTGGARGTDGRCSDLVATAPATSDGHTWIAHTNDLGVSVEDDLIAVEWIVPGEPAVWSVGIGPWISVGWNSAGLVLSGNELTPNDERVGVPRLLMVREQLTKRSLGEATVATLRPDRASSYNTVLADPTGSVTNVEGSATDAELVHPSEQGLLVHTNHFACARMRPYEGDPAYARRSNVRYERAMALLAAAAVTPGSVTPELLMGALADHENAPDSICRHPAPGIPTKTVFWALTDVDSGRATFGRGNPCRPHPQILEYRG
jgi:isopenicillin-N N-acyltransferase-like protein